MSPRTSRLVRGLACRQRVSFVLVLLLAGSIWTWSINRPTALDLFWRPVIDQRHSVILCLGGTDFKNRTAPSASGHANDPHQVAVAWWDAETLARLAGTIQSRGAWLQLLRGDEATFSDFQQRPAVLIGAYNDPWTLELMSKMRYTFQQSGNIQWIKDRDRPSFQDWKNDLGQADADGNLVLKQDYAIISRVSNPRTGFITVTVAGLWGYGTLAAGRFLTNPAYMQDFVKRTGFKVGQRQHTDRAGHGSDWRQAWAADRAGCYFLVAAVSYVTLPWSSPLAPCTFQNVCARDTASTLWLSRNNASNHGRRRVP